MFRNFVLLKPKLCDITLKFNCNNKKKIIKKCCVFNIKFINNSRDFTRSGRCMDNTK